MFTTKKLVVNPMKDELML